MSEGDAATAAVVAVGLPQTDAGPHVCLALRSLPSGQLGALGDANGTLNRQWTPLKRDMFPRRLPRLFVDRQALNGPLTCHLRSDQSRCEHE